MLKNNARSTLNFCTLFDKNYLLRGLALIESLKRHEPLFQLYVLAMDDIVFDFFTSERIPQVTVIRLSSFESPELLSVKNSRSKGEYCWTCTPLIIDFCIDQFSLDHCTYIDADIFFFSTPRVLIEEVGPKSILLTEHNYTPEYDQTITSGKYCVQFMYFRNNPEGRTALTWWKERCLEWCYARHENGKFGDQKYLDDWTTRFPGVHELIHPAGALAPWNIQQFEVSGKSPLTLVNLSLQKEAEAVLYHFHDLKFYANGYCDLGIYKIPSDIVSAIYAPYLASIQAQKELVQKASTLSHDFAESPQHNFKRTITLVKRMIKGNFNYFKIVDLIGKDFR